jgi:hypothetical protein
MPDAARLAFVAIPCALVIVLMLGVRRAWVAEGFTAADATRASARAGIAALLWMAATGFAADSGVLREWDRTPPPMAVLVLGIVGIVVAITFTAVGTRLARSIPLWVLVGVQGFRLPLELAMHEMSERGVMPSVMSYSGRNFDIITGATAIALAVAIRLGVAGRRAAWTWNLLGSALVLNVVVVAILATPMVGLFGPTQLNVWVTYLPYVWLPAVMVVAAMAGHLIIFRALRSSAWSGVRAAQASPMGREAWPDGRRQG